MSYYMDPDLAENPWGRDMQVPGLSDGLGRTQLGTEIGGLGDVAEVSAKGYYDPTLKRFYSEIRKWNNRDVVKRAVERIKRRAPALSAPEALLSYFFDKKQVAYFMQQNIAGGKLQLGGEVADFILPATGQQIEVNGVYYHQSETEVSTTRVLALGQIVAGVEISSVNFITDQALYRRKEEAVDLLLLGLDQS
jgi:hypothetical protein